MAVRLADGNLATFRWLGVAGLILETADCTLAIDPYLTRASVWRIALGKLRPDRRVIAAHIPHCDYVLVTHPHFDHLLDVPEVVAQTGAVACGSPNTCRLLRAAGVAASQMREINVGAAFRLGDFAVDVVAAKHIELGGRPVLESVVPSQCRAPLRAWDYRMDFDFSFLIRARGLRVLVWSGPGLPVDGPVDVAFVNALAPGLDAMVRAARTRVLVPIHWDDFTRSADKPVRPTLRPSGRLVPPLRRFDPVAFERSIVQHAPDTRVFFAERFRRYTFTDFRVEG